MLNLPRSKPPNQMLSTSQSSSQKQASKPSQKMLGNARMHLHWAFSWERQTLLPPPREETPTHPPLVTFLVSNWWVHSADDARWGNQSCSGHWTSHERWFQSLGGHGTCHKRGVTCHEEDRVSVPWGRFHCSWHIEAECASSWQKSYCDIGTSLEKQKVHFFLFYWLFIFTLDHYHVPRIK